MPYIVQWVAKTPDQPEPTSAKSITAAHLALEYNKTLNIQNSRDRNKPDLDYRSRLSQKRKNKYIVMASVILNQLTDNWGQNFHDRLVNTWDESIAGKMTDF